MPRMAGSPVLEWDNQSDQKTQNLARWRNASGGAERGQTVFNSFEELSSKCNIRTTPSWAFRRLDFDPGGSWIG